MIDRYISIMPKTAFFALLIIYGNIIPSGECAELCPKYPLGTSSSVSGIIVSSIITTEKIIDGVLSYFYYLSENSWGQVIGINNRFGNFIFKYLNKIQDFSSKIVDGVQEQLQSIYGSSSGIVRSLIDSVINLENSFQSYIYGKLSGIVNFFQSGHITAKIGEEIRNPVESTKKTINALKSIFTSFIVKIKTTLKGGAGALNGGGLIKKLKEAAEAPLKATKEFLQNSTIILQTLVKDSVAKFEGFVHQLEKGSLSEKLSAAIASPVGAIQEIWNLVIKSSASIKSSIFAASIGLVQPLLGSTLTVQLNKLINLPFDLTQGIWNTIKGWSKKLDDFVASVTGGGSLSVRINVVLSHPLDTLKNTCSSSVRSIKSITRFIIGDKATEQLGLLLSSPLSALNGFISAITGGGSLSTLLNNLISKPTAFITGAWNSIKVSIKSFTRSIAGEGFSNKLNEIISAPGNFLSGIISSITGGGNFSEQISNLLTKPWITIKNTLNGTITSIKSIISSITGGGSFSLKLNSLLTKPFETLNNFWISTKNAISGILGENITASISKLFSSPFSFLNGIISSITGGGSLSLKLNSLLTKPFETLNSFWISTKNAISGVLGGDLIGSISKVLLSPITFVNGIISSLPGGGTLHISITNPIATIKNIWRSTIGGWFSSMFGGNGAVNGGSASAVSGGGGGSVGGSVSVSGGSGGGISGALSSILKGPGELLKGSLDSVKKTEGSVVGGLKGIINHIPIIGHGGSIKAGVDIKYGSSSGGSSKGSGSGSAKGSGSGSSKGSGSSSSKGNGSSSSKGGWSGSTKSSGSGGSKGSASGSTKASGSGRSKSSGGGSTKSTSKGSGSFSGGGSISVGGSSKGSGGVKVVSR